MNRRGFFGGGLAGLLGMVGLGTARAAEPKVSPASLLVTVTDEPAVPAASVSCDASFFADRRFDVLGRVVETVQHQLRVRQLNPATRVNLKDYRLELRIVPKPGVSLPSPIDHGYVAQHFGGDPYGLPESEWRGFEQWADGPIDMGDK
jgi:hypothetical protein